MESQKYIPKYTFEDYKIWKGDWELIEGHPVSMSPSPVKKHQLIGGDIFALLHNTFPKNDLKCNCKVFYELDWKVRKDTILRPDIMIVCDDRESDFVETVPVLIVEVFSPSTYLKDRNTKFKIYEENGVSYYIMVDPDSKKIEIFQLIDNKYKEVDLGTFKLNRECSIQVDLDSIFE